MKRSAWILAALLLAAAPLAAQSVTIQVRPDTAFKLFATYRTATGAIPSRTTVTVVSRAPATCKLTPVPGTTRGRYQFVHGQAVGSCWVVASARVNSRTYADSVYLASAAFVGFRVAVTTPPPDTVVTPPPPPPPPVVPGAPGVPQATIGATSVTIMVPAVAGTTEYRWQGGPNAGGGPWTQKIGRAS